VVELEDEHQLHLFNAQTAKLHPNHSSAEELKNEYLCSIPSTPHGVRQVCIFLFVFFIHPNTWYLFLTFFFCISIAGSDACNAIVVLSSDLACSATYNR
jgi:hypothetical protein